MDVDDVLGKIGGYRRWNISIFTLLGISMMHPLAWQGLSIVFVGWEPEHHCKLGPGQNVSESIPLEVGPNGEMVRSKCRMYAKSSPTYNRTELAEGRDANATIDCTNGWEYDNMGYFTIVEQWDLVCGQSYLSELTQVTYQVGCLFAEVVFAYLVDRFGRKLAHIVSHLIICIIGIGAAFSSNYIVFTILRMIIGMMIVANVNSGFTLCMELFDHKLRALAGIGLEFQWIFCYLTLPLFGYYATDWRVLQLAISVASVIWIVYFWILTESPVWLVAAGRYDEADDVLIKIARWNQAEFYPAQIRLRRPGGKEGIDARRTSRMHVRRESILYNISPETINSDLANISVPMSVPVLDIFRNNLLRRHLLVCSLLWFANCLVYYGLILTTPKLAGNRFINFLIMGFVELPAIFLTLYTTDRWGRCIPTAVYHIIAGIPLAIVVFIPKFTKSGTDLSPLIITLVMVSKFAISASFAVILVYTKELFPTNLRGTGNGVCQILGRIGLIFAPMGLYAMKTSFYWVPNVAFGVVSIAAGAATLILPETTGHPLPQNLSDIHALYRPKTELVENNHPCNPMTTVVEENSEDNSI